MSDEQGQAPEPADTTTIQQAVETTQQDAAKATTQHHHQTTDTAKPKGPEPTSSDKSDDLASLSQADLAKMIRDLRKENGADRTNAKQQAAQDAENALVQKLGEALGLVKADKPPSAEDLTKQLTETAKERDSTQTELRTMRVERAAEKAARTHGADVDTLLDSRSFATKLAGLDPTADDFTTAVSDLVKTTVDANPKYKATQAAASSSADFSSGPGEKRSQRPNGLYDAVSRAFG